MGSRTADECGSGNKVFTTEEHKDRFSPRRRGDTEKGAKNKTFETQRKGRSGGDWVDEEGQPIPQMNADQGTKSLLLMNTNDTIREGRIFTTEARRRIG